MTSTTETNGRYFIHADPATPEPQHHTCDRCGGTMKTPGPYCRRCLEDFDDYRFEHPDYR